MTGRTDKRQDAVGGSDDFVLFEQVMDGVRPLNASKRGRERLQRPAQPEASGAAGPRKVRPALRPAVRRLDRLEIGRTHGLDRGTAKRLCDGAIRPEARLDLHGRTVEEACKAVAEFVARSQMSGRRCVLVITGKGSAGPGSGVIRGEFSGWLNAPENRARIVACAPARPADGGGGAFYVYLKKAPR